MTPGIDAPAAAVEALVALLTSLLNPIACSEILGLGASQADVSHAFSRAVDGLVYLHDQALSLASTFRLGGAGTAHADHLHYGWCPPPPVVLVSLSNFVVHSAVT